MATTPKKTRGRGSDKQIPYYTLKKIKDLEEENGDGLKVGFTHVGPVFTPPKIGERFRIPGFKTEVIIRINADWTFETKKSVFQVKKNK